jgi:hypothetical protein
MSTEYGPGRTATSSPAAALAEVVCADPDLLALEFDALMAANYPDSRGPSGPLATAPDRPPARPTAAAHAAVPPGEEGVSADRRRAGRRGTCLGPAARAAPGHTGRQTERTGGSAQEVMP